MIPDSEVSAFFQSLGEFLMPSVPKTSVIEADYQLRERQTEHKSQYDRGEVLATAGARRGHLCCLCLLSAL